MKLVYFLLVIGLSAPAFAGDVDVQVLDRAGKPVEDAVVYVRTAPGKAGEPRTVIMDQVNKELVPRVLPVVAGSSVTFPNKDEIHHHLYSFSKAKEFEVPLYKHEQPPPVVMDKLGVVKIGCNIHDWMRGYIIVLNNPYFAKTDAAGRAELKDVPEGRFELELWSETMAGDSTGTRQTVFVATATVHVRFSVALVPPKKKPAHASTAY